MAFLRWLFAENRCALRSVLASPVRPSVEFGATFFIDSFVLFSPIQKQVTFSSRDFPFLCVLWNEPSGGWEEGSK
jgi:hypothetical protein